MKKILYFVAALAAASFITTTGTSCKFAPDQHDGDTVAASEFYPIDTSAAHAKKMAKIAAIKNGKDSVGIYYVGSNSTKDLIERILSFTPRHDDVQQDPTHKGEGQCRYQPRDSCRLLSPQWQGFAGEICGGSGAQNKSLRTTSFWAMPEYIFR